MESRAQARSTKQESPAFKPGRVNQHVLNAFGVVPESYPYIANSVAHIIAFGFICYKIDKTLRSNFFIPDVESVFVVKATKNSCLQMVGKHQDLKEKVEREIKARKHADYAINTD